MIFVIQNGEIITSFLSKDAPSSLKELGMKFDGFLVAYPGYNMRPSLKFYSFKGIFLIENLLQLNVVQNEILTYTINDLERFYQEELICLKNIEGMNR